MQAALIVYAVPCRALLAQPRTHPAPRRVMKQLLLASPPWVAWVITGSSMATVCANVTLTPVRPDGNALQWPASIEQAIQLCRFCQLPK